MDMIPGSIQAPDWCAPLLREFGQNPMGENIMRIVWAPSRLMLFGGFFAEDGGFAYRRMPKYGDKRVFVLEKWVPGRHYGTPKLWRAQTTNPEGYLSIGPYPARGVYECTYMFGTEGFGFVPLLPELVHDTARAIHRGRWNKVWDIRAAIMKQEEAKEVLADKNFEEMWESAQGVRRGLSFGAGGKFNHDAKVEEYKRRIVQQGAWERYEDFSQGFSQGAK